MTGSFSRRWAPLLFIGIVLAALILFARVGNDAAAHGRRVLSSLDPAAEFVKSRGGDLLQWLWRNGEKTATAVTVLAILLAVGMVAFGRRRALPLLLLPAGALLATWGQVLLWRSRQTPGVWLYLAGVACAVALGLLRPLRRLPGFPTLPPLKDDSDLREHSGESRGQAVSPIRERPAPVTPLEWAAILALTLVGLFLRGYALTELPNYFDDEMVGVMAGSYTGYGIRDYLRTELLGTGAGVYQVATHFVLYRFLPPSVFSIRLAALVWGVAAIPLLYWLVRRIAGRTAALIAAVLFVAAPEQLYWGRNENTHFAPVAVLAIVTAHLGLTMVQRFSPRSTLAAALWMPVCRFSYTPSWALFTLPLLLAGHAVVFVRGMWRKLHYAVPILAFGLLLWIFSVSVLEFALAPKEGWRFIHPAKVRREAVWKHDMPAKAGPLEIARLQAMRISKNTRHVLAGMTFHATYTSSWYIRMQADGARNTSISAGLAVLCALGIGYLLGQLPDRRAALLLGWIVVGLLPGVMSDEPEARRISLVFPALPAVAGVFGAAALRMIGEGAGSGRDGRSGFSAFKSTNWVAELALALALGLTAFTSLASHLLIPLVPIRRDAEIRFARPLYERCEIVLHNLTQRPGFAVALGNLDHLLRAGPPRCTQLVEEKDWPAAAVAPACDFSDQFFSYVLSPDERKARAEALKPGRVGYLLRDTPESRPHIDLLARLYPSAVRRELPGVHVDEGLIAMEVPMTEIERLRAPKITGATMRGSLILPSDGWYRFRIEPDCAAATLLVGTPPAAGRKLRPLAAGLHPFAVTLPSRSTCELPVQIRAETVLAGPKNGDGGAASPVEAARDRTPLLLSPEVAGIAPAPSLRVTSGWGDAKLFAKLAVPPFDIGVDGQGAVHVLVRVGTAWEVHRFGADGRLETTFRTELPVAEQASMAIDDQGTSVVNSLSHVEIRDRAGKRLTSWTVPQEPPSDLALWRDGRILVCFPRSGTVQLFSRDGKPAEILRLPAEDNVTPAPAAVAVSSDGMLLVVDEKGTSHLFRSLTDRFAPERVATFRVLYPEVPFSSDLKGCAFGGADYLLFPHRSRSAPLVYDFGGRRILATAPERDLATKGLQRALGFSATTDALYVLDEARAVLKVSRQ